MSTPDHDRPCASRFILQKFKKQMGVLSAFFETEKRETKGRLERLLVVADSTPSSEAMLKMLESYYVKEDTQNEYAESRVPETTILDVSLSGNSRVPEWKPVWMEYLKPELVGSIKETAALSFKSGRLYRIEGSDDDNRRLENILGSFPADSRDQVISILQSKIVSQVSQSGNFEVILYGDTATRIASKVLALTGQGKGFTLPWECGSFVKMPSGISSSLGKLIQVSTPSDRLKISQTPKSGHISTYYTTTNSPLPPSLPLTLHQSRLPSMR